MSTRKAKSKKPDSESEASKTETSRKRAMAEDDCELDLPSDMKDILSALQQYREKSLKDSQKKKEETISSVASDVKSKLEELKSKLEKERQSLAKALSKSSKECENLLMNETAKHQAVYEKFCKEKVAHLQDMKDTISKFEEEKERLLIRYEQQRKKEKSMISEFEKACQDKIVELEESLKKKKQDEKTFSILRKTLDSFVDDASDEDIPADY